MLEFVGKGLSSLKSEKASIASPEKILYLDLTMNKLEEAKEFSMFPNLRTVVIDDNRFQSLESWPSFPHLETFSANKNDFYDLGDFLEAAKKKFPQLKNLSLLKNPLNPFFEGDKKYGEYRDIVLEALPGIRTLDGVVVTVLKKRKSKEQEDRGKEI